MIESWNLGYKFQIYKRIDGNSLTTDTSLFVKFWSKICLFDNALKNKFHKLLKAFSSATSSFILAFINSSYSAKSL